VDKKAFNSRRCQLITSFLEEELKVEWTHKVADIKKRWETSIAKDS
jgi:hypothetical protein